MVLTLSFTSWFQGHRNPSKFGNRSHKHWPSIGQFVYSFPFCLLISDGQAAFRSFLESEFSEENLEFWMACEDYRKLRGCDKLQDSARKIYDQYITIQAPKEVGEAIDPNSMLDMDLRVKGDIIPPALLLVI